MIHTPFLCDHPLFIPDSKIGLTSVQCSPILSEYKYKRYMKSLLKKNRENLLLVILQGALHVSYFSKGAGEVISL